MVLKKGDFVRINFTGRVKETGEVFDTTYESVAKEHGLYDPKMSFRQRPVIIGARHVISGVDKALEGAEVGEKKVVVVPPEDGFGQRDPSKVRVVPLREFKKSLEYAHADAHLGKPASGRDILGVIDSVLSRN